MRRRCGLLKSDENRNFGPRLEPGYPSPPFFSFGLRFFFFVFAGNFVLSCCKLVKSSLSLDQEFCFPSPLPIHPPLFLTVQREAKIPLMKTFLQFSIPSLLSAERLCAYCKVKSKCWDISFVFYFISCIVYVFIRSLLEIFFIHSILLIHLRIHWKIFF